MCSCIKQNTTTRSLPVTANGYISKSSMSKDPSLRRRSTGMVPHGRTQMERKPHRWSDSECGSDQVNPSTSRAQPSAARVPSNQFQERPSSAPMANGSRTNRPSRVSKSFSFGDPEMPPTPMPQGATPPLSPGTPPTALVLLRIGSERRQFSRKAVF